MKYFVALVVVLACANKLVQSIPLDEIDSDHSLDKIKDDLEKILQKFKIEIPEDLKFPDDLKIPEGFKIPDDFEIPPWVKLENVFKFHKIT